MNIVNDLILEFKQLVASNKPQQQHPLSTFPSGPGYPANHQPQFQPQQPSPYQYQNQQQFQAAYQSESQLQIPGLLETPLPPGWVQQWSDQYGRYFYAEVASGKSTWDRPQFAPPPPVQPPTHPLPQPQFLQHNLSSSSASSSSSLQYLQPQNGMSLPPNSPQTCENLRPIDSVLNPALPPNYPVGPQHLLPSSPVPQQPNAIIAAVHTRDERVQAQSGENSSLALPEKDVSRQKQNEEIPKEAPPPYKEFNDTE